MFSPEAARAFSISDTGQLAPDQNASFLNQRLAALRDRYGFSRGMSDRGNQFDRARNERLFGEAS